LPFSGVVQVIVGSQSLQFVFSWHSSTSFSSVELVALIFVTMIQALPYYSQAVVDNDVLRRVVIDLAGRYRPFYRPLVRLSRKFQDGSSGEF